MLSYQSQIMYQSNTHFTETEFIDEKMGEKLPPK